MNATTIPDSYEGTIPDAIMSQASTIQKLVDLDKQLFPEPVKDKEGERMQFGYGTAGFRTHSDYLD